ncbi:hypothetical protein [Nocardia lasii]|uniref:Excalibur calcium-binding domain-containing protein n=1 Tax=Nocardia lasii TaxID=1616107 RepID=A0ABW1JSW2_9NOCA
MRRALLTGTAVAAVAAALTLALIADTDHPAGAAPGRPVAPAPHILPFAEEPGAAARAPLARRDSVQLEGNIDGCDHRYGTAAQCVPWTLPAAASKDRCGWLRERGLVALPVVGADRLGLDRDRDGIACGKGD